MDTPYTIHYAPRPERVLAELNLTLATLQRAASDPDVGDLSYAKYRDEMLRISDLIRESSAKLLAAHVVDAKVP